MQYSNDMFYYMFKAEFVTLVSLKVPSGCQAVLSTFQNSCVQNCVLFGNTDGEMHRVTFRVRSDERWGKNWASSFIYFLNRECTRCQLMKVSLAHFLQVMFTHAANENHIYS